MCAQPHLLAHTADDGAADWQRHQVRPPRPRQRLTAHLCKWDSTDTHVSVSELHSYMGHTDAMYQVCGIVSDWSRQLL